MLVVLHQSIPPTRKPTVTSLKVQHESHKKTLIKFTNFGPLAEPYSGDRAIYTAEGEGVLGVEGVYCALPAHHPMSPMWAEVEIKLFVPRAFFFLRLPKTSN